METKYIKMNNNQTQLSLGNFCRIVKELSLNKTFANQTEIFYCLFGVENVSDSTINNYCIGYRPIGTNFKKIYIKYKEQYPNNKEIFDEVLSGLISSLDGQLYQSLSHEKLIKTTNTHQLLKKLCLELYNLAKNDESVDGNFTKKIHKKIIENNIYETIIDFIFYIILEKKQPIYIDKVQKELIENILNSTNISMNELEKFLKLQMKDGINYTYSLKTLVKENNPYACFEVGNLEYMGQMVGYPRYIKALEYFKIAAQKNHPRANWLIAQMIYQKKIGSLSQEDLKEAWNYLKNAEQLGSVAAVNTIGLCYLKGFVPGEEKSETKAIEYFKKASAQNYVYAHNNLGQIYEVQGNYQKAFEYYSFSANLEESWSCNKLGEFYRNGIYVEKNLEKAFHYYNLATDVPENILNHWAYYNLAKYFYLNGNHLANVEKDTSKAISYFTKASHHGVIQATEALVYIYIDEYLNSQNDNYIKIINDLIFEISKTKYYEVCHKQIEEKLKLIEKKHLALVKNI